MSYGLAFNERATEELRELEPWLQEETLDELDKLAIGGASIKTEHIGGIVHDVVRDRGGVRFYVFSRTESITPRNRSAFARLGFTPAQ